ncbi:rhomboid family intramembrane serine protease [Petrimonas sp.]|uniref:rhomboid family intramembrane serine protease n=1 Tax=Petrimonas sp. TaxID=2023866 RepID=UPI003F51A149
MDDAIVKTERLQKKRIWLATIPALVMCALIWLIFLIDFSQVLRFNFSLLGIYPRQWIGLSGVVFSPFVHGSFSHLISNTVPLLILITLLFYFYNQIAFKSLVYLWLLSGFFTWIIGRNSYHVGASGLIFALVFFLFFSGLFRKYIPLVAVSMVVAFAYGSTVWSIFPITEYIDVSLSWEGHLSGAIAGFIVALIFRNQGPQKPETFWNEEENDEATGRPDDERGSDEATE